jgi:NAD(P)-dependent dehydrogenase (short-subunit alcohol dehydrogenase family)
MKDRIAVIAGASSGIGEAIAIALLNEGAAVANAGINEPCILTGTSTRYFFRRTDISIGEEVQQLYNYVHSHCGSPSILICNAGEASTNGCLKAIPKNGSVLML